MNETIFSIANAQNSPGLRKIGRNMIKGEKGFAEIEYRNQRTGKLSWITYAPVPLNGWSLGIFFRVDEFMDDANRMRLIVIGLGLGGGVILILIIVLISRSITSSLRRLTWPLKLLPRESSTSNFRQSIQRMRSGGSLQHFTICRIHLPGQSTI